MGLELEAAVAIEKEIFRPLIFLKKARNHLPIIHGGEVQVGRAALAKHIQVKR